MSDATEPAFGPWTRELFGPRPRGHLPQPRHGGGGPAARAPGPAAVAEQMERQPSAFLLRELVPLGLGLPRPGPGRLRAGRGQGGGLRGREKRRPRVRGQRHRGSQCRAPLARPAAGRRDPAHRPHLRRGGQRGGLRGPRAKGAGANGRGPLPGLRRGRAPGRPGGRDGPENAPPARRPHHLGERAHPARGGDRGPGAREGGERPGGWGPRPGRHPPRRARDRRRLLHREPPQVGLRAQGMRIPLGQGREAGRPAPAGDLVGPRQGLHRGVRLGGHARSLALALRPGGDRVPAGARAHRRSRSGTTTWPGRPHASSPTAGRLPSRSRKPAWARWLPCPCRPASDPPGTTRRGSATRSSSRMASRCSCTPTRGRLWMRVSAQVYNDEDDIDRLGEAIAARVP